MVENGNWKWYNQIVNHNIEKIRYVNLFNRRYERAITWLCTMPVLLDLSNRCIIGSDNLLGKLL